VLGKTQCFEDVLHLHYQVDTDTDDEGTAHDISRSYGGKYEVLILL
jgi:hypothetical protein